MPVRAGHVWEPPSTAYGVFGVSRRSGMTGRSGTYSTEGRPFAPCG